jgi:hypothetical protein
VIGDGNPDTLWFGGLRELPNAVFEIRQNPDFGVSRELHIFNSTLAVDRTADAA